MNKHTNSFLACQKDLSPKTGHIEAKLPGLLSLKNTTFNSFIHLTNLYQATTASQGMGKFLGVHGGHDQAHQPGWGRRVEGTLLELSLWRGLEG